MLTARMLMVCFQGPVKTCFSALGGDPTCVTGLLHPTHLSLLLLSRFFGCSTITLTCRAPVSASTRGWRSQACLAVDVCMSHHLSCLTVYTSPWSHDTP